MYVAAINSTFVVDVRNVLAGSVRTLAVIPNATQDGCSGNSHNISISHQADVTADGKILVITDESGGGTPTPPATRASPGVIGGMHFWALAPLKGIAASKGASPSSPKTPRGVLQPEPDSPPRPARRA